LENDLTTTDTVQELQQKLYHKAKSNADFRFYALYDKVYRKDVLKRAWEKVKANKGAEGVDAVSFEDIEKQGVESFLQNIEEELREKTYRPKPSKRVYIPKPDSRLRPLSIPTIKDRVVQSALRIVIEPIFEADFEDCSFGFRVNRSAQQAACEVRKLLNMGYTEVVETDIEDCFGSIPHRELLDMIAKRIVDGKILWLVKLILKAGVVGEDNRISKDTKGTPQGGAISPLLANIYLNNIDKGWRPITKTARLIRYADDLLILSRYKADGYKIKLEQMVNKLKLRLKPQKTRILNANHEGFDFLGFRFVRGISKRTNKLTTYYFPAPKAVKAIKQRIRQVVDYRRPQKAKVIAKELTPILRGWVNYFRIANSAKTFGKVRYYTALRMRKFICRRGHRAGYGFKSYTEKHLYGILGLYNDYRISWMKAL
jgi:RNA-directed DNA polymerase